MALTIPACTNTQQMSAAVAARVAQLKGNATATVAPETAAPGGLRISIPSISLNLTGAGANASTPEALSNIAGSVADNLADWWCGGGGGASRTRPYAFAVHKTTASPTVLSK